MCMRERTLVSKNSGKVYTILQKMGINPETVLIFIEGRHVPDDFRVSKETRIVIKEITSGG